MAVVTFAKETVKFIKAPFPFVLDMPPAFCPKSVLTFNVQSYIIKS